MASSDGTAAVAVAPRETEMERRVDRAGVVDGSDRDPLAEPPPELTERQLDAKGDALFKEQPELALAYWRWASVARVARLHGRPFKHAVRARIMAREALKARVRQEIRKEYPPEKLAADSVTLWRFGFTADQPALGDTFSQMLSEEIAGFYDPDTKELYLIGEPAEPAGWLQSLLGSPGFDEQKIVLDHEIGHALQDQSFDLFAAQASVKGDDDALQALTSLVEGDAVVLMMVAMLGEEADSFFEISPELLDGILGLVMPLATSFGTGEAFTSAPKIVQEQLMAPYIRGFTFAYRLWGARRAGQTDTLAAAFADPPRSTEQILHPAKYTGPNRDDPQRLILGPAPEGLVGRTVVKENCVGEFALQVLLRERLGEPRAGNAAAGWDGDTYRVVAADAEGGSVVVAWAPVWDTEDDAAEFARAIEDFYADGSPLSRPAVVQREGDRVAVVLDGPSGGGGLTRWLLDARSEAKRFAPSAARASRAFPDAPDPAVTALMAREGGRGSAVEPPLVRLALDALGVSRLDLVTAAERLADEACAAQDQGSLDLAVAKNNAWFEEVRGGSVNGVDFDRIRAAAERFAECVKRLRGALPKGPSIGSSPPGR